MSGGPGGSPDQYTALDMLLFKNQGLHENLNVTLDQISKLEGEIQNGDKSNSELERKYEGLNEFLKIAEDQNSKLEKEIQNVKESRLCKICLDRELIFCPFTMKTSSFMILPEQKIVKIMK